MTALILSIVAKFDVLLENLGSSRKDRKVEIQFGSFKSLSKPLTFTVFSKMNSLEFYGFFS